MYVLSRPSYLVVRVRFRMDSDSIVKGMLIALDVWYEMKVETNELLGVIVTDQTYVTFFPIRVDEIRRFDFVHAIEKVSGAVISVKGVVIFTCF
jgi:hypothetical protein